MVGGRHHTCFLLSLCTSSRPYSSAHQATQRSTTNKQVQTFEQYVSIFLANTFSYSMIFYFVLEAVWWSTCLVSCRAQGQANNKQASLHCFLLQKCLCVVYSYPSLSRMHSTVPLPSLVWCSYVGMPSHFSFASLLACLLYPTSLLLWSTTE